MCDHKRDGFILRLYQNSICKFENWRRFLYFNSNRFFFFGGDFCAAVDTSTPEKRHPSFFAIAFTFLFISPYLFVCAPESSTRPLGNTKSPFSYSIPTKKSSKVKWTSTGFFSAPVFVTRTWRAHLFFYFFLFIFFPT
jgi:hypothetical protein